MDVAALSVHKFVVLLQEQDMKLSLIEEIIEQLVYLLFDNNDHRISVHHRTCTICTCTCEYMLCPIDKYYDRCPKLATETCQYSGIIYKELFSANFNQYPTRVKGKRMNQILFLLW